ncbi:MAG: undecaprenyldiphospho-muramoylpentapeptide beta-N-acetylglucosaminyltransferase [Rhizobiales bacterium]|nr:undecaprenyldiphospho-muramoylpentapeptide beta-N-acetylglucosaminyltransferase [Hyphomicrobiales bacterium]
MASTALLVAGGTGGHLFPALALREALVARGWRVHLATDPRVGELIEGVPAAETHRVPSATLAGGSPLAMLRSIAMMAQGVAKSRALLRQVKPRVVVGFGGYPTVPPLVAARLARLPILVHEQNAVVGRANKLLIAFGAILATGFERPNGGARAREIVHVGNPVRAAVANAARPYQPAKGEGDFRLLVFGGSQGARVFSGLVPGALALLGEARRSRVRIVQQARPEDIDSTRSTFSGMGVPADVEPFFTDMGVRLAAAHLVLCRAGASTVAELAALGRPAILVPYPHALDHDQAENARALAEVGGAWIMPESELDPSTLARKLASLMDAPDELTAAAEAARAQGRLDAAERLADLVERCVGR